MWGVSLGDAVGVACGHGRPARGDSLERWRRRPAGLRRSSHGGRRGASGDFFQPAVETWIGDTRIGEAAQLAAGAFSPTSAARLAIAWQAYSTSCTVTKGPKLKRVAPPSSWVLIVACASGAQWMPERVRMP